MLDFFCRFLRLKGQAPDVSDEQAITQAIKALRVSQLHSHLVRQCREHWNNCKKIFANSVEQRYYTFISWVNRENPEMTMKVQGRSSTTRAKRVHQVLTHLTNKFTASTWMDAGH
jgi:hypothetical protein